jgi:hypothetical protein
MTNEEETKIKEETSEVSRKKKDIILKSIGGLFGVFTVVILVIINSQKDDFPMYLTIILGLIGIIIGAIIFFGFYLYDKIRDFYKAKKDDKSLPEPMTMGEARNLAKSFVVNTDYADMIPHCLGEKIHTVGEHTKTNVYEYKSEGVYSSDIYYIIINMHFPHKKHSVLINPTPREITIAINSAANEKDDKPDEEVTTEHNPLLGTERKIVRTTRHRKDKEKSEQKKGDLE